MRHAGFPVLAVLLLLVLASGCTTQKGGTDQNETAGNETADNESSNKSVEKTIDIPKGDFAFKIHGDNQFWIPPNRSLEFYVVFNNMDDDEKAHRFIARVHPSVVDFDVMAAYKCLHFTTCDKLLKDMEGFMKQPKTPIKINHTSVGLYTVEIRIPVKAVNGTYMYNMVACEDMTFGECTETAANWGPNIPVIVHVI